MFSIRQATPADAATIHHFICELARYEREPDAVEVDVPTLTAQMQQARPPFECLIAERDGEALGFALYFQTYSTWRGQPGLWLEDLFVPQQHRGNGIGKALLGRVAAIVVERGYARLDWSVLTWNTPAIDFYRSLDAEVMEDWRQCRLTRDPLQALSAWSNGRDRD